MPTRGGLGDLIYALSTGDVAEQGAYDEQLVKTATAEDKLAAAGLKRQQLGAKATRKDWYIANGETPERARMLADADIGWGTSANDLATAGATRQSAGYQAEGADALRAGDMALGNRMLIAAEGKPVELTKITGDTAFNPYTPDAALVTTPVGESVIRENNANATSLGAQAAKYAAEASNARTTGGRTPSAAVQNWEYAQNLPPDQRDRFLAMSGGRGSTYGKPLPASLQKEEDEDIESIQLATSIDANLQDYVTQIEQGRLDLGLADNLVSKFQNYSGASTENSRNFASFQAGLEKLRNDSLRLNKGVQTEGDAIRAWNEILANINDGPLVAKRLKEVQALNLRAADLKDQVIQNRRNSYRLDPLDTSNFRVQRTPEMLDRPETGDLGVNDYQEGEILTNPQTGERIILQSGQWVPL